MLQSTTRTDKLMVQWWFTDGTMNLIEFMTVLQ